MYNNVMILNAISKVQQKYFEVRNIIYSENDMRKNNLTF